MYINVGWFVDLITELLLKIRIKIDKNKKICTYVITLLAVSDVS